MLFVLLAKRDTRITEPEVMLTTARIGWIVDSHCLTFLNFFLQGQTFMVKWIINRYVLKVIILCRCNWLQSINQLYAKNIYFNSKIIMWMEKWSRHIYNILETMMRQLYFCWINLRGKIFWSPMLLKKYSDFSGGKKNNNLIQSFCHIT